MPPRRIPRRVYRASARVLDQGGPEGKLRGRPPPPHCRAPDLGDGRGLNPSPDEREPAGPEYYSRRLTKTTRFAIRKRARQRRATRSTARSRRWAADLLAGGSHFAPSSRSDSDGCLSRRSAISRSSGESSAILPPRSSRRTASRWVG